MPKNKKDSGAYSEEIVKRKRRFPTVNTVAIVIMLIVQIVLIAVAILSDPQPQDRIDSYEIFASPRSDGTVDIEYRFVWTPLDEDEALSWVEIGMPNPNFTFYNDSFSSNIITYKKYIDDYDYVSARLYFDRDYTAGETLTFSFKIRQCDLLFKDGEKYFYEFIPGWFNATPVESYRFIWNAEPEPISVSTASRLDGNPVWEGSMPCGSYVKMQIHYGADAFYGVPTVKYEEFYDGDIEDSLKGEKAAAVMLCAVACVILLAVQIYLTDSVVSYHRGRGFLTGYGHHVHIYGYTNPKYEREKKAHAATHGGGRSGGGGCACACACACAGGGRAGCSQKDTKAFSVEE